MSSQFNYQKHFYFKLFSLLKQFYFKQFSSSTQLNVKTVLFQVIQFSISMHFISISLIDRTLSGATTPGQSGPGSDGNEGILYIPQSSSITGASPTDCLVSYPGDSLRGSYPSPEAQLTGQPSRLIYH